MTIVNAKDGDSGENGRINYTLSDEASEFLEINDRGVIRINKSMSPAKKQFPLNITITDNGQPPLSNSINVTVTVISNESGGGGSTISFTQQEINMYVEEHSSIGKDLGSVAVFVNHNNKNVSYEIVNDSGDFKIESQTGKVSTNRVFDREKQDSHDFVVKVNDSVSSDLAVVSMLC